MRKLTPGVAALCVLGTLALQSWPGVADGLQFTRPRYEAGAVWLVLTSQWVHLSLGHAMANGTAFGVVLLASRPWVTLPRQLLALGGGYVAVAVLLAWGDCGYYAGASGALHGLLAGNAVRLGLGTGGRSRPRNTARRAERAAALLLLALLGLKLWWQGQGGGASAWDFPVYHPAHLAGALGGIASALLAIRPLTQPGCSQRQ